MVYFLYDKVNKKVKIGRTNGEISDRVSTLNTGNPNNIIELGFTESYSEPELHAICSSHHSSKEWYHEDVIIQSIPNFIIRDNPKLREVYSEMLNSKNKAKIAAAKKFIKEMNYNGYWFIDEEEAKKINLDFKRSARIKPLCKVLHKEGRIKLFSKKKELKYIGRIDEIKE